MNNSYYLRNLFVNYYKEKYSVFYLVNKTIVKDIICEELKDFFQWIFSFKTMILFFNKNDLTFVTPIEYKSKKKRKCSKNKEILVETGEIEYNKRILSKILYKKFYSFYDRTILEHYLHFLKINYKIFIHYKDEENFKINISFFPRFYKDKKKYSLEEVKKDIDILFSYIPYMHKRKKVFSTFSIITKNGKTIKLMNDFLSLTEELTKRLEDFFNDFLYGNFFNNYDKYKYENMVIEGIKDINEYFPNLVRNKEKVYTILKLFHYDQTYGNIPYYNSKDDYFIEYFSSTFKYTMDIKVISKKIALFNKLEEYFSSNKYPKNLPKRFNYDNIIKSYVPYDFIKRTSLMSVNKLISNRIYFLKRMVFITEEDYFKLYGKFFKTIKNTEKKEFNKIIESYLNNEFFPQNIPENLLNMGNSKYIKFIDYFNYVLFNEYLFHNKNKDKIGEKSIEDMLLDFKIVNFNFLFPTHFFNFLIYEHYPKLIKFYRKNKVQYKQEILFKELVQQKKDIKQINIQKYLFKILATHNFSFENKNINNLQKNSDINSFFINILKYDLLSPFVKSNFHNKIIDYIILFKKNELNFF